MSKSARSRRIPSNKSVAEIRALAAEAIAAGARPQRVYRALARRWRVHVRTITRYVYAERRVPSGDLVDVQPSHDAQCARRPPSHDLVRMGPLSGQGSLGSNIARDPARIDRGAPGRQDDGGRTTDSPSPCHNRKS